MVNQGFWGRFILLKHCSRERTGLVLKLDRTRAYGGQEGPKIMNRTLLSTEADVDMACVARARRGWPERRRQRLITSRGAPCWLIGAPAARATREARSSASRLCEPDL